MYTLSFLIETELSGLTLKAALFYGGVIHETFRDVTETFYEDGVGGYEFLSEEIPTGYRGLIIFYTGTLGEDATDFTDVVVYGRSVINPQQYEGATAAELAKVPKDGETHKWLNVSHTDISDNVRIEAI